MKIFTAQDQFEAFQILGKRLEAAQARVSDAEVELKTRGIERANLESDYERDLYKIQANLIGKGESAAGAKVKAKSESSGTFRAWKLAEVVEKSANEALWIKREQVRDIRQKMSNFQSVVSMARTEAELAGKMGET